MTYYAADTRRVQLGTLELQHLSRFKAIYADPPWTYNDKRSGRGGVSYPTLTVEQIMGLGPWVEAIADRDAVLFLWVTWPFLREGLDVIRAWGFEYRTLGFLWVKTNKVQTDTLFWGCGQWTRSNSEICLLGIKGSPARVGKGVHQLILSEDPEVVFAPTRAHSEKPAVIRDRIVELCGDVPRVELFSRHIVDGWHYHGNEVLDGGVE